MIDINNLWLAHEAFRLTRNARNHSPPAAFTDGRQGVEYRELSRRLADLGVVQSETNLRSKVNNGSLGAQLFLYIQLALDTRRVDLETVGEILTDVERDLEQRDD